MDAYCRGDHDYLENMYEKSLDIVAEGIGQKKDWEGLPRGDIVRVGALKELLENGSFQEGPDSWLSFEAAWVLAE